MVFYTQNHPTMCVLVHCVNQILSLLGHDIKYDEFAYPDNILGHSEYPHSSYDIKYWNFEYKVDNMDDNWYIKHIINIYDKI